MSAAASPRAATAPTSALDALRDIRARLARSADMERMLDGHDGEADFAALLMRFADERAELLRSIDVSLAHLSDAEPTAAPTRAAPEPPAAESRRFLIVEASLTIGRVLTRLLTRAGHCVRVATDMAEAEALLAQGPIDIALVDLDTASPEAMKDIGRVRAGVPRLIGLAQDDSASFVAEASAAGFDGLIAAPADPAELLALAATSARVEATDDASSEKPAGPSFDVNALRDLEKLGGEEFARDIARHFLDDAKGLLATIRDAAEAGDEAAFRDQAHALRSCAANVGARAIYEQCLAWRALDAETLARSGRDCAEALEREYRAVSERISAYARCEAPLGD